MISPHRRTSPSLLFGVPIDDVTMEETLAAIGQLIITGREQQRCHQITTVNVDFLVNAITDAGVRRLLQGADMCVPDGMPVVWAGRAAGMPLRERVAGADLVPALAALSVSKNWRIHLFGSAEGTAERAAELLRERNPGAIITGNSGPFITDIANVDDAVIDEIRGLEPDVLCVALGNPKQERFIATYGVRLGVPVMIGVGGTLDFLVGGRNRAPMWMQKAGIEWVARAAQEPTRLGRRYARDARVFLPHLISYLRQVRSLRTAGGVALTISDSSVVVTPARADPSEIDWQEAVRALRDGRPLSVHLAASTQLRVEALAGIVGLIRVARQERTAVGPVVLSTASLEGFRRMNLSGYLDDRDM